MATFGSDEYSVIGDKGEIGFIDFEDDKSVYDYDKNEEGAVIISIPFPFTRGKPQSVSVGETLVHPITIRNTTSDPLELWGVHIFCSNPADSFTLSLLKPPSANSDVEDLEGFLEGFSLEDRVLQPHKSQTVWLSCKPKEIGLHTSVVHFDVEDERIERVVFLLAEDKISQSLASKKPYSRCPTRKQTSNDGYATAGFAAHPGTTKYKGRKSKLPLFEIPTDIRELLENKQVPEVISEGLMKENYVTYFNTLLVMEELHLEKEMRCHDMEKVSMRRQGASFALRVPGLAERRPSLVHGDFACAMLASQSADETCPPYQGEIYRIEADEVLLRFGKEFRMQYQVGDLYNLRFTYNRVNMRRLYLAVRAADSLETNLLFPSQPTKRSIKSSQIVPCTSVNEEQLRAVEMILGCEGAAPPYVIHGPPGTGKTMTLVEAILQLYTTRKSTQILVCAASNSAADHILEKLVSNTKVGVKDNEIFRLNATSRNYEDVRANHIRFCFFEEFIFKCPPVKAALMCYRVIISTYMSSSLLHAEGIRRGHFSHIFLDEAGQASEPETMVPMSNFCQRDTVVVLAGDPMQLGPVVHSRDALEFGLGRSYLERLFGCQYYHSTGDRSFITKLVRNYRSHPAILHLPSKLFYNGKLLACKEASSLKSWQSLLPNKEFPVLFHGIQGCDEREGNDPSWFNRIEVSKVVGIVKKLIIREGAREEDIGVIAPYRQQVVKISKVLESFDMPKVKVGSVEQFQGQEREVIIVSTVRSTARHKEFDKTYCLGFLSNPKRFNVAVTRARSLLVIVGNPHIVSKDPYWHKLLWQCADNYSYQGCPLPERQYHADREPYLVDTGSYEGGGTQTLEEGKEEISKIPQPANI